MAPKQYQEIRLWPLVAVWVTVTGLNMASNGWLHRPLTSTCPTLKLQKSGNITSVRGTPMYTHMDLRLPHSLGQQHANKASWTTVARCGGLIQNCRARMIPSDGEVYWGLYLSLCKLQAAAHHPAKPIPVTIFLVISLFIAYTLLCSSLVPTSPSCICSL